MGHWRWAPRPHERFGPVDVLVNNAGGVKRTSTFEALDEESRRWELALNIDGVVNCTQAVAADMLPRGKGSVINNLSLSVQTGGSGGQQDVAGGHGPLQIAGERHADHGADSAAIESISLNHDDGSSEPRR